MTTLWRKRIAIGACLCLTAAGLSCNSDKPGTSTSSAKTEIVGAGSTFVTPIMGKWIDDFQKANPQVQINYQSIGSGGGIQQLKKGLLDLGASDAPLSDQQLKEMPPLVQLPETAGPVCITYNLPGVQQPLKLGPATLAGIYLGKIKKWNDPAIARDNPGVKLPDADVVPLHRTESSGTTNLFTTYLDSVSPEWHSKVGKGVAVNWPVGMGGKGSEGITGVVKETAGAIGYVELAFASQNNLPVAQLRNAAGKWISPSPDATSAAIAAFKEQLNKDVRSSIVNPPASAPQAYPISGLTYLLIPKQPKDATKGQVLNKFVLYILDQGQDLAVGMNYAKLPQELQQLDKQLLGQVAGGSANAGGQ